MQRRKEERTKRKAKESISESGSSEEEEQEDPVSLDSNDEEYQGSKTPSQSDPVDESETPAFKIHRPTTRSTLKKPTACPKRKAAQKQEIGNGSKTRKMRRY